MHFLFSVTLVPRRRAAAPISLKIPADPVEKDSLLVKFYSEIQDLKHELSVIKRLLFGQKRERFVPAVPEEQLTLEGLFETAGAKVLET